MDKILCILKHPDASACLILRESVDSVDKPILSIAVPTYKRFDLLKETLDSIFSLSFSVPVEVLVVDNDPSHREQANFELSRYRDNSFAYYKNTENLGMFGNWNQCLALAKGKYVTVLHDDDLLLPEFAAQMNELLRDGLISHEIVGFTVGMLDRRKDRPANLFQVSGGLKKVLTRFFYSNAASIIVEKDATDLFFTNFFCGTLGVVMNREMALSIGGFNADWYPIADYEFWCRWATHCGNIQIIKKKVGLYRMQQNESLRPEVRKGYIKVSTALRQKLVSEKAVPYFFQYIIDITASVQERSVNLDWRTKDEPDPVIFRMVTLRLWCVFSMMLSFLFRKSARYRRFF